MAQIRESMNGSNQLDFLLPCNQLVIKEVMTAGLVVVKEERYEVVENPQTMSNELEVNGDHVISITAGLREGQQPLWKENDLSFKQEITDEEIADAELKFDPSSVNVNGVRLGFREICEEKLEHSNSTNPKTLALLDGVYRKVLRIQLTRIDEGLHCGLKRANVYEYDQSDVKVKVEVKKESDDDLSFHQGKEDRQKFDGKHCQKTFVSKRSRSTRRDRHQGLMKHKCYFCDYMVNKPSKLLPHFYIHTMERPLKCDICGFCGKASNVMNSHKMRRHAENIVHLCCPEMGCSAKFRFKEDLQSHVKLMHHKASLPQFRCEVPDCGFMTHRKTNLKAHDKNVHKKELDFHCRYCGKRFSSKRNSELHVKRKHKNERNFKCDIPGCETAFVDRNSLKTHKKIVHVDRKEHLCSFCGAAYKSKANLWHHIRSKHPEETGIPLKTVDCYICGREQDCWNTLHMHMRIHTREHLGFQTQRKKEFQLSAPTLRCPHCTNTYKSKHGLKNHIARVHEHVQK